MGSIIKRQRKDGSVSWLAQIVMKQKYSQPIGHAIETIGVKAAANSGILHVIVRKL